MKLPGRAWIVIHRTQNRWWDLRAILAGYCNHCPGSPIPGQGGGYLFWRCGLRRGHEGLHRSNNYVWDEGGTTSYMPLPYSHPQGAHQPRKWNRKPGWTMRQARALDAWHREQDARRRARLEAP